MAVLADKKVVGAPFSNASDKVIVEYNFADDTGGVANYDVLEADGAIVCCLEYIEVVTAVTSAGACQIDLGVDAGGQGYAKEIGKSRLSIGSIVEINKCFKLADAEKVVMGIKVAAITAGKLKLVFSIKK